MPSSGGFQLRALARSRSPVNDKTAVAFPKLATGTPFEMGVVVGDVAGNFDGAFVTEPVR